MQLTGKAVANSKRLIFRTSTTQFQTIIKPKSNGQHYSFLFTQLICIGFAFSSTPADHIRFISTFILIAPTYSIILYLVFTDALCNNDCTKPDTVEAGQNDYAINSYVIVPSPDEVSFHFFMYSAYF